jgi:hypothetical protein
MEGDHLCLEWLDLDQPIGLCSHRCPLKVRQRSRRAEVTDASELLAANRATPGPQDLVEKASRLGGELDLDRLGRVADEDQVRAVVRPPRHSVEKTRLPSARSRASISRSERTRRSARSSWAATRAAAAE